METESNAPPIWLDQTPIKVDIRETRSPKHQSSQLTTSSNDTDFTATTTNTTTEIDSIVTSPSLLPRNSQLDLQHIVTRDLALRRQYEQHPEKVPDVAAEMEKWFALTDRYGFLEEAVNEPTVKQKEKEVERAEKWAKISHAKMINHESAFEFVWSEKFRKRVYKGIPDCWRREAWYFLITDRLKDAVKDAGYKETYQELLQRETSHERQIDLDIPRTLRDHIMFKQRYGSGQRALFNVLRAFANYDEEVGYCQGMTNIAATLLMYCEEEKAFLILVHMFLRDKLHNLYIPGFPTLMESFFIQEKLLRRYLPKLLKHLAELGLSSDVYSTRWYITLFTGGVINYHTLLRIWDAYFLCGYDIFFFVAIALLSTYEKKLLASDLDVCMEILGSTMSVPDDNKFMRTIEKLYAKNARMNTIANLRKEYQSKH